MTEMAANQAGGANNSRSPDELRKLDAYWRESGIRGSAAHACSTEFTGRS